MLRKTVYDLIEQLVMPVEMQAIDILTEFAEFDELSSDPGEIQQMLESLGKLFEDEDMYYALVRGSLRNQAVQDIRHAMRLLEHRLDKILSDTRGYYFPDTYPEDENPTNLKDIGGPGLYHFITVSGRTTQTLVAEDSVLAAITFGDLT